MKSIPLLTTISMAITSATGNPTLFTTLSSAIHGPGDFAISNSILPDIWTVFDLANGSSRGYTLRLPTASDLDIEVWSPVNLGKDNNSTSVEPTPIEADYSAFTIGAAVSGAIGITGYFFIGPDALRSATLRLLNAQGAEWNIPEYAYRSGWGKRLYHVMGAIYTVAIITAGSGAVVCSLQIGSSINDNLRQSFKIINEIYAKPPESVKHVEVEAKRSGPDNSNGDSDGLFDHLFVREGIPFSKSARVTCWPYQDINSDDQSEALIRAMAAWGYSGNEHGTFTIYNIDTRQAYMRCTVEIVKTIQSIKP